MVSVCVLPNTSGRHVQTFADNHQAALLRTINEFGSIIMWISLEIVGFVGYHIGQAVCGYYIYGLETDIGLILISIVICFWGECLLLRKAGCTNYTSR